DAYRHKPQPLLLYNLARACEGMGDLVCASDAYARYLEADPSSPDRGAVEQRVATLKRQIEQQRAEQHDAGAPALPPAGPRPARRSPNPVPWVVAGGGVLGLGAGAVFGVLAKTRHDAALNADSQQAAVDTQADAKRYATIADVLFVAGTALTVVGVAWTIL